MRTQDLLRKQEVFFVFLNEYYVFWPVFLFGMTFEIQLLLSTHYNWIFNAHAAEKLFLAQNKVFKKEKAYSIRTDVQYTISFSIWWSRLTYRRTGKSSWNINIQGVLYTF